MIKMIIVSVALSIAIKLIGSPPPAPGLVHSIAGRRDEPIAQAHDAGGNNTHAHYAPAPHEVVCKSGFRDLRSRGSGVYVWLSYQEREGGERRVHSALVKGPVGNSIGRPDGLNANHRR